MRRSDARLARREVIEAKLACFREPAPRQQLYQYPWRFSSTLAREPEGAHRRRRMHACTLTPTLPSPLLNPLPHSPHAEYIERKGIKLKGTPLYLDMQATTPLDPRVLDAMLPYMTEQFGNPHSR